jgi:predicted nucleic acid-binding protein
VLLLDASVWAALVDPRDRHHRAARALVTEPSLSLAALDLTFYEIANAIGVKMGRVDDAMNIVALIRVRCRDRLAAADTPLFESALEIAAEHGLTAYDAAYVAAAQRNGWSLVSLDIADLVSKGLAVTPDAADYP